MKKFVVTVVVTEIDDATALSLITTDTKVYRMDFTDGHVREGEDRETATARERLVKSVVAMEQWADEDAVVAILVHP